MWSALYFLINFVSSDRHECWVLKRSSDSKTCVLVLKWSTICFVIALLQLFYFLTDYSYSYKFLQLCRTGRERGLCKMTRPLMNHKFAIYPLTLCDYDPSFQCKSVQSHSLIVLKAYRLIWLSFRSSLYSSTELFTSWRRQRQKSNLTVGRDVRIISIYPRLQASLGYPSQCHCSPVRSLLFVISTGTPAIIVNYLLRMILWRAGLQSVATLLLCCLGI